MRTCLPPESMSFLADLAENNHKDWFDANRKRYEHDLKVPARELIAAINEVLADLAPDYVTPPNKAIGRINRDIRFSRDKTPYNTHIWAAFMDQTAEKNQAAGFYVGIRLDEVGFGAGTWMPPKPAITRLRQRFADDYATFEQILTPLQDRYGALRGDAYKRVPKPWPADHPAAEWLKLKSPHLATTVAPTAATQPDFVEQVVGHFAELLPFVEFLSGGLRG
jgi:uncharacterized protein (TIGR02453 family)